MQTAQRRQHCVDALLVCHRLSNLSHFMSLACQPWTNPKGSRGQHRSTTSVPASICIACGCRPCFSAPIPLVLPETSCCTWSSPTPHHLRGARCRKAVTMGDLTDSILGKNPQQRQNRTLGRCQSIERHVSRWTAASCNLAHAGHQMHVQLHLAGGGLQTGFSIGFADDSSYNMQRSARWQRWAWRTGGMRRTTGSAMRQVGAALQCARLCGLKHGTESKFYRLSCFQSIAEDQRRATRLGCATDELPGLAAQLP